MATYWKEPIKEDWIKQKITNEGTVEWAKKFGIYLAKEKEKAYIFDSKGQQLGIKMKQNKKDEKLRPHLTTNQLRKFFGEVKRIQAKGFKEDDKVDFILLKPKLAYAVARVKDEDAKIHDFYFVLSKAIDLVETEKDFKRFIQIFEAIVAYHKAAEDSKLITENIQ